MIQMLTRVTSLFDSQLRRIHEKVPDLDWATLGYYAGPLAQYAGGHNWRVLLVTLVVGYLVWEQSSYLLRRRNLPGPVGVPPLVGNVVAMVLDPAAFWKKQASFGPMSWNALVGK
jgi:hypothetical protein